MRQLQSTDCGAACLAMVLGYYGKAVRLDDVRSVAGAGREGASALSLLRAGERFGLRGRGFRLEVEDLAFLPKATILHWGFNHWLVYEAHSSRGVHVVDPGMGQRFIPMDQFRREFTGVALSLEPGEQFEPTSPDKSRIWVYVQRILKEPGLLWRVLVLSVLLRLFALSLPILTGIIVDRVVPRGDRHLLTVVAVGLVALLGFQFLSQLIRAHLLLQLRTNLDTRMTLGFVDYLVDLPYAFFQRRSAGDLMMRVNSNATIREILSSNMLSALLDGILCLLYLVLLFLFNPFMALLVLGLALIQCIVYALSRRRTRELMSQGLEAQARSQGFLVQVMAGIETLKALGGEHRAVEHWSNLFVDEVNASLKRSRLQSLVDALNDVLRTGSPLLILSVGTLLVVKGELSLGTMLALNALATGFLTPVGSLLASALQMQLLRSYVERIDDVLRHPPEQDRDKVRPAPKLRGKITVEHLSFRYDLNEPLVVRDVSLEIAPGRSIAIVGRSGCGKSTLASLLLGFHGPAEGRIFYDGHDLASLDARSVRRQLGVVPQSPYLFGSSIRANLSQVDPNLNIERVIEAAKLACIHDDIMAMSMGYESILADGGASLSGGQRQRLALARALVHRPAILVLDEATSHLDTETEAAVMRNLESLKATRIIIAHRLSTIMNADLILVMDAGRVVEQGTHAELLSRCGTYRDLVAAQTGPDRTQAAS